MKETVTENCMHEDCKYRTTFNRMPCCGYMLITNEPRGCKISECDKYQAGEVKIVSTPAGLMYQNGQ